MNQRACDAKHHLARITMNEVRVSIKSYEIDVLHQAPRRADKKMHRMKSRGALRGIVVEPSWSKAACLIQTSVKMDCCLLCFKSMNSPARSPVLEPLRISPVMLLVSYDVL